MSFDSLTYLLFLPAVCLVHWLLPSRLRWILLLGASYIFYASWNLSLSLLILAITAVTWVCGLLLDRTDAPLPRRCLLGAALLICLGALGFFKYYNFLGSSLAALTGGVWRVRDILLPVGISFYTFQALSYVADVYRRSLKAERHFGYYALYISFFPQLVAGPIERAGSLIPQLRKNRVFSPEDLRAGLRLILSGFFRKIAVADLVAPFVNTVFAAAAPDGSAVAAATLLFALQIYGDFSGYSEIAAGSARLLGIRLMRNFDRPYAAPTIREFWRRWHISLTVWFTDYVYIPLGGSRKGLPRQMLSSAAVFALCGLWHGADWSFLVWGLLHAVFLNLYTLRSRLLPNRKPGPADRILTLAAVCFAWVFFRADSLSHAALLLGRLFSFWNLSSGGALLASALPREAHPAFLLLTGLMTVLMLIRLPRLTEEPPAGVPDAFWAGILLALLLAALIRMDGGAANAFLYFQF